MNEYEELRKNGWIGFAHRYLKYDNKPKSDDDIDIQIYIELVELDSKLGTTASEQLLSCLEYTTRSDILKVSF